MRNNLSSISAVRVQGTNGSVSLGSIAHIQVAGGPTQINRLDRMRNITLSIELDDLYHWIKDKFKSKAVTQT